MTAVTERVAAGAKFLDMHDPDWWRADVERAIDLEHLDLADPSACILGQRCPVERLGQFLLTRFGDTPEQVWDPENYNFWALAYEYSGISDHATGDLEDDVAAWSNSMGFNTRFLPEFPELTAEWRRVIQARRAS